MRLCIYTSDVGASLKRVAQDIASAVRRTLPEWETQVLTTSQFDTGLIKLCDACTVVAPFDMVWGIVFMFIAYEHRVNGVPALVYTTIEGSVAREMVRNWVLRDLCFIANSSYTRDRIAEVGARVIDVIYHGVDVDYIASFREKGEEFRSRFDRNKVVVGYIAQGHERKGHELFASVVREVESRGAPVEFFILTDKKGRRFYEGTSATVSSSFGMLSDEDYYGIVSGVDVYAHGALAEGFGIPVLEALAAGKIVVHPSYRPLTEITTREVSIRVPVTELVMARMSGSGIIFELKQYRPAEFASAVVEAARIVLERGERLREMSARAVERARQFSIYSLYPRLVQHLLGLKAHRC